MRSAFLHASIISVFTAGDTSCIGATGSPDVGSEKVSESHEVASSCSDQLSACIAEREQRIKSDERKLNLERRTAIGLRSLLPMPNVSARSTLTVSDIVGAWQSGYNPALSANLESDALPMRLSLIEERIEFKRDGRVCGVDIVMDRSGGHYPFYGEWALESGELVETFKDGRAPISLGQSVSRRRKIAHRAGSHEVIRFDGAWPNRYELVPNAERQLFRFHNDEGTIEVGELPKWCFQ
jgi:hypothetical protein